MGRTSGGQNPPPEIAANDILANQASNTASAGPTVFITIPAGRTWVGTFAINVSCAEVAAGVVQAQATGILATSGVGVVPAAGPYLRVSAYAGAGVVGGTTGESSANAQSIPITIIAPVGNSVNVTVQAICAGTQSEVNSTVFGTLV